MELYNQEEDNRMAISLKALYLLGLVDGIRQD